MDKRANMIAFSRWEWGHPEEQDGLAYSVIMHLTRGEAERERHLGQLVKRAPYDRFARDLLGLLTGVAIREPPGRPQDYRGRIVRQRVRDRLRHAGLTTEEVDDEIAAWSQRDLDAVQRERRRDGQ